MHCLVCGSDKHTEVECPEDDVLGIEGLGGIRGMGARAALALRDEGRVTRREVLRTVYCGVLRFSSEGALVENGKRTFSMKCPYEAFKIEGIVCPSNLEENLLLEGVSVDGADRMGALFKPSPPPLWALRNVKLDVAPATNRSIVEAHFEVRLGPVPVEFALTGRIVR
jgi:hypothetical protein